MLLYTHKRGTPIALFEKALCQVPVAVALDAIPLLLLEDDHVHRTWFFKRQ